MTVLVVNKTKMKIIKEKLFLFAYSKRLPYSRLSTMLSNDKLNKTTQTLIMHLELY